MGRTRAIIIVIDFAIRFQATESRTFVRLLVFILAQGITGAGPPVWQIKSRPKNRRISFIRCIRALDANLAVSVGCVPLPHNALKRPQTTAIKQVVTFDSRCTRTGTWNKLFTELHKIIA
jgi:hypothetical protein